MTTSISYSRGAVLLWELLVLFARLSTATSPSTGHVDHSITLYPRSITSTLPYFSCTPVNDCAGTEWDKDYTCIFKETAFQICKLKHPTTSTSPSTSDSFSSASSNPPSVASSSSPRSVSSPSSTSSSTTPTSSNLSSSSQLSTQNVATTPKATSAAPTFNSYVETTTSTTACVPAPSGCSGLTLGADERC